MSTEDRPDLHEQYDEDEEPEFINEDDMVELDEADLPEYNGEDDDEDGGDEDGDDEDGEDVDMDEIEPYEVDPNLKDHAVAIMDKHTDAVVSLAIWKKDPSIFVSGSCDEVAYVSKINGNKIDTIATLGGHTDTISAIAFNFDGSLVATASYDATIQIWKTADWSLCQKLEGPADDIEFIDWHPRGNAIIAGSKDATSWMWWATNGNVMQVFTGHGDAVVAGAFGLDGKAVCTASIDGSAVIFNPRNGQSNHTFDRKTRSWHQAPLASLATHPTQPLMATGDQSGEVVISNIESGSTLVRLDNHNHSLECLSFANWNHNPAMLLSAALDGTALIRDCSRFDARCSITNTVVKADDNGEPQIDADGFVEGITRAKWHPTGLPLVVTAGNDATARMYDARDGSCLAIMTGHQAAILDMDIIQLETPSAEGAPMMRVITGGDDKTVRVFEVPAKSFNA